MQAKAVAFKASPLIPKQINHPALNIWQSLYYELIDAGLRKEQIAAWVELTPRSIDRLLAGNTKQPSFKVLSRMLRAYCCYTLKVNENA